jgi:hypothetical protein
MIAISPLIYIKGMMTLPWEPGQGQPNDHVVIDLDGVAGKPLSEFAMQNAAAKWLVALGLIIGLNASGWADGSDGKGNGPLASKLRAKPADLTTFAKKNNGVFPLSAVYEAMDGRNEIKSHTTREMPIWGCRRTPSPMFATKASKRKVYKLDPYESHLDLSCDSEDIIGNRILSVIEYLRRIQEK